METRLRGYRHGAAWGLFHARRNRRRRSADTPLGPELRAFNYARRVKLAENADYEKTVRRIRSGGERSEYLVLHLISPVARNAGALGLDIYGEGARRASIERARDTGALVASPAFGWWPPRTREKRSAFAFRSTAATRRSPASRRGASPSPAW
jgi:hypothetical protein